MNKVILIGAGGHSKVIQDIVAAIDGCELYAIVDDAFDEVENIDGIIHAPTDFLKKLDLSGYKFCIAIGNNTVRRKLFNQFQIPLEQYASLVHPSAVVSDSSVVGHGTVVMAKAVINAETVVGNHCIVNTGSVVEHDNVIDDYVHISPNATLSGGVRIGAGSHIGAGATVIPSKSVGEWTTVGAGGVVVEDIENRVVAVGVPAQVKK